MKNIPFALLFLASLTTFAQSTCTTHNPENSLRPTTVRISKGGSGGPCDVMDNDLTTKFSYQNTGGIHHSITFEFDAAVAFDQVQIAFHESPTRSTYFDIEISNDYSTWTPVLENILSAKLPLGLQNFDTGSQTAQYIRFVGLGTDYLVYTGSNTYITINEFKIIDSTGGGGVVGGGGDGQWSNNTNGIHYDAGNVGIGVDLPTEKLEVNGQIHAREVKVDVNFPAPDYVFYEDYNLKTLDEIQQYINEYGHLPNIPSAEEIEANGIALGVMNMKLLEKIEELTLYILEQDKIQKEQNEKLEQQRAKQQLLEQRIKKLEHQN